MWVSEAYDILYTTFTQIVGQGYEWKWQVMDWEITVELREDTMLYMCYVAYTHLLALEPPVEVEVVQRQSSASLWYYLQQSYINGAYAVQSVTNFIVGW